MSNPLDHKPPESTPGAHQPSVATRSQGSTKSGAAKYVLVGCIGLTVLAGVAFLVALIVILGASSSYKPPPRPSAPTATVPATNEQTTPALPFFEVIETPGSISISHKAVAIYIRQEDPKTLWAIAEHYKAQYPYAKTLYLDFYRKKISFDELEGMSDAQLKRVLVAEYYGGNGAKEEFFYTASTKPVPKP